MRTYQVFSCELSFRKKKWLLCCLCNHHRKDQNYSTLCVAITYILKSKGMMVRSYEVDISIASYAPDLAIICYM